MLPWIALAANLYGNMQQKKQDKKNLQVDLLMNRARELGANTSPLEAQRASREIEDRPLISPGALVSAIGASGQREESIDDRLAREMARRGLMRGYEPF